MLFSLGGGSLESAAASRPRRPRASCRRSGRSRCSLGLALLVAAAWRAPTLRLGLRRAALGFALAGGLTVAATSIARAVVLSTFDTSHGDAVVGTIWSAFLADLRLWALAVGAVGVIAAAAFEPGAPGAWRRVLAARDGAARAACLRLARAVGLVLLAVLLCGCPRCRSTSPWSPSRACWCSAGPPRSSD